MAAVHPITTQKEEKFYKEFYDEKLFKEDLFEEKHLNEKLDLSNSKGFFKSNCLSWKKTKDTVFDFISNSYNNETMIMITETLRKLHSGFYSV